MIVRREATCIAILLASISAVYASALTAAFQFDDFNVIVDYSTVHSLHAWFDALPSIRPLLKLSYALNWMLAAHPFGFHVVNLLCHLLSAALVFLLGLHPQAWPHAPAVALGAALLFALHPAQTEAVTYISGRSVSLMSVFYLGALLAAISARKSVRNGAAPLLLIAALLTKETAWTLPFAVLLVLRVRGATLRESLQHTRALWVTLLAGLAMLAAIPAYRRMANHVLSIRAPLDNVAVQVDGWWYLLTHPLLGQINIDPDLPASPVLDTLWWLKCAVLLLGIFYALCTRRRGVQFALLWFFLHLLPTNSLLPRNDIANDRQLYLALIGPALAVAHAFANVNALRLRAVLMPVVLILCAVATWQRNDDYRDEISLWQATVRESPHKARAWNNLGYAYQLAGQREAALQAYARALTLNPGDTRARINESLLRDSP